MISNVRQCVRLRRFATLIQNKCLKCVEKIHITNGHLFCGYIVHLSVTIASLFMKVLVLVKISPTRRSLAERNTFSN